MLSSASKSWNSDFSAHFLPMKLFVSKHLNVRQNSISGGMVASTATLIALCFLFLSITLTLSFECNYRASNERWNYHRYWGRRTTHLRQAAEKSNTSGNIKLETEDEVRDRLKTNREVPSNDQEQNVGIGKVLTESYMDSAAFDSLKVQRSYVSILVERGMQTLDDSQRSSAIKASYKYKHFMGTPFEREQENSKSGSATSAKKRESIVVLGTGWGSHSFIKTIDGTKYDVKVVSPRNYFTFTPMLAASAVGTVETRSIVEPIRNVNPLVDYFEAAATAIDTDAKTVKCEAVKCQGASCEISDFDLPYDYLVVGFVCVG
jgi:hypothetical protein